MKHLTDTQIEALDDLYRGREANHRRHVYDALEQKELVGFCDCTPYVTEKGRDVIKTLKGYKNG